MERPEIKNPIKNAKVIASGVSYQQYTRQVVSRGDKAFVMSRGEICDFSICPQKWIRGFKSNESSSTEWGELIDCLALTPERFESVFAVTPETYPDSKTGEPKKWNWNANWCKEWGEQIGDRKPVKYETKMNAEQALRVLFQDEQIKDLINCSDKQVMVTGEYHDKETGIVVPVRGLIDLAPKVGSPFAKCLADFKTCASAHPNAWPKHVFEYDYHVQAALYLDLYRSATGEERLDFRHILQESSEPYQTGRRIVSDEFVLIGRNKYLSALKRYCQCLSENRWDGYDDAGDDVYQGWRITQPSAWMVAA